MWSVATHIQLTDTLLLFISPIIPTPIIISYTQAATEISYLLEKIHKTVIELLFVRRLLYSVCHQLALRSVETWAGSKGVSPFKDLYTARHTLCSKAFI